MFGIILTSLSEAMPSWPQGLAAWLAWALAIAGGIFLVLVAIAALVAVFADEQRAEQAQTVLRDLLACIVDLARGRK